MKLEFSSLVKKGFCSVLILALLPVTAIAQEMYMDDGFTNQTDSSDPYENDALFSDEVIDTSAETATEVDNTTEYEPPEDPAFYQSCGSDLLPLECKNRVKKFLGLKHSVDMYCNIRWPSAAEAQLCSEARKELASMEDPFESVACGPYVQACVLHYLSNVKEYSYSELGLKTLERMALNTRIRSKKPLCPINGIKFLNFTVKCAKENKDKEIDIVSCLKDEIRNAIGALDPANFPNHLVDPVDGFVCRHYSVCMSAALNTLGIRNTISHIPKHVWNTVYHSDVCTQQVDCLNDVDYVNDGRGICHVLNATEYPHTE